MIRLGGKRVGAAMVEAAVCLAVFTPVVLVAVRLGYGVNQVHDLEATASEAARRAGACESPDSVREFVRKQLPGLAAGDISIDVLKETTREPAQIPPAQMPMVRVTIANYRVERLRGPEPMAHPVSALYPYACD